MELTSAVEHREAQERLILSALALARRHDWAAVLAAYQVRAGRVAMAWLPRMLEERGIDPSAAGRVSAAPMVGRTGQGLPAGEAYAKSPSLMQRERLMQTILADTARQVMAAGMAARPAVTGYVRVVEAGACSRCVVLAGRWYRYNEGFRRHPKCRCFHQPSNRPGDRQNPQDLFDAMTAEEQDATFGKAGAEAIRMGADMGRVVNARAGIQKAQLFGRPVTATTVGMGRRRLYAGRGPRLMPETILSASESREQAIEMLRRYGYLI